MRIEKWYLDSITPDGAGLIAYAARFNLGPFSAGCSEGLEWRADSPSVRSGIALGGRLPTVTSDEIRWGNRTLGIAGRWQSKSSAIPSVILHEEPAGQIEWTCWCPAAPTMIEAGREHRDGFGYAERLVLTLPLRKLPIRELRWGRFIAAGQSCIWIRWQGSVDRNWCFHNGCIVQATMPDLHLLTWPDHQLHLDPGIVLRTGRISDTALNVAGPLRWLLPASVRNIQETKWCSRGVLTDANGTRHDGWTIHEVAILR
ncbi:MAG TPA: hypothetical protein VFC28_07260 [Opitutaceae bacterium]|jgi:hypothetical protein|nr:hypothetical protein [Opitutaceae bacterium]